jgi:hypothetical protein
MINKDNTIDIINSAIDIHTEFLKKIESGENETIIDHMWISTISWLHSLLKRQQNSSLQSKENNTNDCTDKENHKISLNDASKIEVQKVFPHVQYLCP